MVTENSYFSAYGSAEYLEIDSIPNDGLEISVTQWDENNHKELLYSGTFKIRNIDVSRNEFDFINELSKW